MFSLCIIPARGGSKGVNKKNLIKIGEHTLVERALFTALGCKFIDRIIVSTDSKEIINISNKYGEYAPFIRPAKLSNDEAGSLGVIQHALKWAENNDNLQYEFIILLEPPAPFRLPIHIQEALDLFKLKKASSVMSIIEVGDHHPIRIKKMDKNCALKGFCMDEPDGIRRQDQEVAYIRNCSVNIFSRETIISGRLWGDSPYGYLMDHSLYGINIDEHKDVLTAQAFYNDMKK
jgi:CMP-N-acetylneuraminic acid synthetase